MKKISNENWLLVMGSQILLMILLKNLKKNDFITNFNFSSNILFMICCCHNFFYGESLDSGSSTMLKQILRFNKCF